VLEQRYREDVTIKEIGVQPIEGKKPERKKMGTGWEKIRRQIQE